MQLVSSSSRSKHKKRKRASKDGDDDKPEIELTFIDENGKKVKIKKDYIIRKSGEKFGATRAWIVGDNNILEVSYCLIIGRKNFIKGDHNIVIGDANDFDQSCRYCTIQGEDLNVNGRYHLVLANKSVINGDYHNVSGYENDFSGNYLNIKGKIKGLRGNYCNLTGTTIRGMVGNYNTSMDSTAGLENEMLNAMTEIEKIVSKRKEYLEGRKPKPYDRSYSEGNAIFQGNQVFHFGSGVQTNVFGLGGLITTSTNGGKTVTYINGVLQGEDKESSSSSSSSEEDPSSKKKVRERAPVAKVIELLDEEKEKKDSSPPLAPPKIPPELLLLKDEVQKDSIVIAADDEKREGACVVCFKFKSNITILPCGHLCLCATCAVKVATPDKAVCPMCFKEITGVVRTFIS